MQKNLIAALIRFQQQVPTIQKNKINPFFSKGGNVAKYADLGQVIDVCNPVLNKCDLAIFQALESSEISEAVFLVTTLAHTSGEMISSKIRLPQIPDPQKMTAAITYFRRSSYLALVGLVGEDEDDGNSLVNHDNKQSPQSAPSHRPSYSQAPSQGKTDRPATTAQKSAVNAICVKQGIKMPEGELTFDQASNFIKEHGTKRG